MRNYTTENLQSMNPMSKALQVVLTSQGSSPVVQYVLSDADVMAEDMEISQILESENTLSFFGANASSLKIKCEDLTEDVRGYRISVNLVDLASPTEETTIHLFDGVVDSQANQTHEDIITTLTAYDWMSQIYQMDFTSWWNSLTVANNNLGGYIDAFFEEVASRISGVTLSSDFTSNMLNRDKNLNAKPDLIKTYGAVSGEMLLKWFAQITCVYLYFDHATLRSTYLKPLTEGLHPHIGLYPRVGLYPYGGSYDAKYGESDYISASYEPYQTEKVDKVVITDQEGIGQGQSPATDGDNALFIDANPFAWAMNMMECAEAIYNRVKDVYFTPSKIQAVYDPRIELGDVVKVYTQKNTIFSYILKRVMKGIHAIFCTYTNKAEQWQESHSPSFASVSSENGKSILKIQADVVEMNEVIATKVTADEVNAQIGNFDYTNTNALTAGTIDAAEFTLGSGHISSLNANVINSGTLSAARIDAAIMRTSDLYSQLAALNYVSMKSVSLNEVLVTDGQTYTLKPKRVTIPGFGAMTILASDN